VLLRIHVEGVAAKRRKFSAKQPLLPSSQPMMRFCHLSIYGQSLMTAAAAILLVLHRWDITDSLEEEEEEEEEEDAPRFDGLLPERRRRRKSLRLS
jgi:hypothetical protein